MSATLVCDLQFGSTGKGLIAGYLAERDKPDTLVTAWMPNAGHTYIDGKGNKYIHTMLANGIVSPSVENVLIGPGSAINVDALMREIAEGRRMSGQSFSVWVHPHAVIVTEEHILQEAGPMTKIGSTKKGCGAAIKEKISRDPTTAPVAGNERIQEKYPTLKHMIITSNQYNSMIDNAKHLQIEGAQGFSLGINSGFYPYCTSRECTPIQIASDCGVPFHMITNIVGCMRTFPIRVANRYDDDGNMIGWSGPGYPDQEEISWERVGVPPEQTTVTKLTRRVFTFSKLQTYEAMRVCHPTEIFLNFTNYLPTEEAVWGMVDAIHRETEKANCSAKVKYFGKGPTVNDVVEV